MGFSPGFSDGFLTVEQVNQRLALMEWCQVWEPSLPVNPGTFGQDDKQQLLWGFPGVLWAASAFDNSKLAHMEWCQIWEPGLPILPGTLGQDDKQQLLWGHPDVLWAEIAVPVDEVAEAVGDPYWPSTSEDEYLRRKYPAKKKKPDDPVEAKSVPIGPTTISGSLLPRLKPSRSAQDAIEEAARVLAARPARKKSRKKRRQIDDDWFMLS